MYFEFRGEDTITGHTRTVVFIALTCACAVGTLMTLLLRNVTNDEDTSDEARSDEARSNEARSDEARSDEARSNEATSIKDTSSPQER